MGDSKILFNFAKSSGNASTKSLIPHVMINGARAAIKSAWSHVDFYGFFVGSGDTLNKKPYNE